MSDLDVFWDALDREGLARIQGWQIERNGDLLYFSLSARDGERYRMRIDCNGYRSIAPDPVFVDSDGSKMMRSAWPMGDTYFDQYVKHPPNCFICMPLVRGGLQRHQEWHKQGVEVWDSSRHSLKDIFNFFQRLLDSEHYKGRSV
jgi:hypothetical protein